MDLTPASSFSTDMVPQSEYRVTRRSKSKRNILDVELPLLPPMDETVKSELKERILLEVDQVVSILVPGSIASAIDRDVYLRPILTQLGLL